MAMNLKAIREKSDMSQPQLAAIAGVSQQTISRLESGKGDKAQHDTLVKLGNALGVTVEQLTGVK